ncbi:RTX-I toxin determinant A from serotypes 1/9 [Anatilimnocola aggregata]|uniref:RTX-I toxin determinant A from serotypes 1/9 n=1 Tax=Anatilimnocola aggregata TaxID=2528021 RepID=A0A517YLJ7_9BACT|nr:cadherin domain-containing protein [Anatilimnocola aggregata]QDU31083.1 RTX-I toxin determinant A from serotypes 1/9 [Anatilimnocola aggregata]
MSRINNRNRNHSKPAPVPRWRRGVIEKLEAREVFSGTPLPVLLVIADKQDFFYQEYGDTYDSLIARGVEVVVAAETTDPSVAHPFTGQGAGDGIVTPDIALADVQAENYSAIAFVGGWGASMYQYAFPGDYANDAYDGNEATQTIVNNLIGDFIDQDKYVAAVCNGVTVLAWARVDGVSPLAGRTAAVPYIGSPAATYMGIEYGNYGWAQPMQMDANGINYFPSGAIGVADDPSDDVWVDGQFITAENNHSAAEFGDVIATHVINAAVEEVEEVPENQAPIVSPGNLVIAENSVAGTVVGQVIASDSDLGQLLTYAIIGGNDSGAFTIEAATGVITVANPAALDFEASPLFELTVQVTDNGTPSLNGVASVMIDLLDELETPPGPVSHDGPNVLVQGTADADTIYIWSDYYGQQFVWINGLQTGPLALGSGGRVIVFGGDGNDQVYATDSAKPVTIYGEGGHDSLTGGSANDVIDGGEGWDRIWAGGGDDLIVGGAGTDWLHGREGNDLIVGGDGDDYLYGFTGDDVLIGGQGSDRIEGESGEDLLIGGTTSYDSNQLALEAILADWTAGADLAGRSGVFQLTFNGQTTADDSAQDVLIGGADNDWLLIHASDYVHASQAGDLLDVL